MHWLYMEGMASQIKQGFVIVPELQSPKPKSSSPLCYSIDMYLSCKPVGWVITPHGDSWECTCEPGSLRHGKRGGVWGQGDRAVNIWHQ